MTPEETVRRAKELVEDPVLAQALSDIEKAHFDRWRSTLPVDHEERERCWYAYQAVDQLRAQLRSVARGQEVEAHNRRIKNSIT